MEADRSLYHRGPGSFARMRSRRPAFLALLAGLLVFGAAFPIGTAQGPDGHLLVQTDYELIGTSELTGGGHVTWTLSGDRARELRAKVVGLFDEYVIIPPGFTFGLSATGLVGPNGVIDRAEALAFTAYLENELEGTRRGFVGTQVGYFRVDRADLFEAGVVERSTTGLLGTDANSSADLQIRFLFNGRSIASDVSTALPSRAFADALHHVFAFEARQSANMTPDPWPLLAEGGWHVVTVDGAAALWAGDDATGQYANGATNVTRTAPTEVSVPGLDLRFATSAWTEFEYRGDVADANDALQLEASPGPAYTSWAVLDTPPATAGTWANRTVDLAAYLGQKVRLRLNFTSDAAGTAAGFHVRGFAVHAPSAYEGDLVESTAHYLIGTLSFTDVAVGAGGLNILRTPGGEILFYGASWTTSAPPSDRVRFQTFSVLENPQFLFAVMIASAYFISWSQEAAYDRYRQAHPGVFRPAIRKARWLHALGRASVAALVLLYFVPTAFYNVGVRFFVSGPAYFFLALTLGLSLGFGSRTYYGERMREAPPPALSDERARASETVVPEGPQVPKEVVATCAHCLRGIVDSDRTYRCTCGSVYHLACAAGMMKCANCRKPIAVDIVSKRKTVSMRCESCGELETIPETIDPRTVICEHCGGRLRHLDEGKGYLLIASNPAIVFTWFRDLTKGGRPGLCLTPAAPDRLRLEYGLQGVEVLQVSATARNAIEPKQLDPVGLKAILPLSRAAKGGVLLYDGLEAIVNASSMGDVVRFIRKANDMAFVHGITVIARVAPGVLPGSEVERLSAEFDETIDLVARL